MLVHRGIRNVNLKYQVARTQTKRNNSLNLRPKTRVVRSFFVPTRIPKGTYFFFF